MIARLSPACLAVAFVAAFSTPNVVAEEAGAPAGATQTPARIALVVGQSDYHGSRLITGTSDASTMSEALTSAGFEVEGGADLTVEVLKQKVANLVERARRAGEVETVLVYLDGRVAQIDGENLLLPVGTPLDRTSDAVLGGFRIDDLVKVMKTIPAKARIVVVDAAAAPEEIIGAKSFGTGLAIVEAPPGFFITFNQSPGRPLVEPQPPMGSFMRAFVDAFQQPVASYGDTFALARQRVFDESRNREMPWTHDSLGNAGLSFFPLPPGTPAVMVARSGAVRAGENETSGEAFKRVIASDTMADYQSFLVRFPKDEAVPTIQYNLAVRREAEVWAQALRRNTREAYWTYLATYPDGGNAEVARRRLALLGAGSTPPSGFTPVAFSELPPPLPDGELVAASASMPIELLPPPPSLGLMPMAAVVAAVAAIPSVAGSAGSLPSRTGAALRPKWSPPPRAAALPRPLPVVSPSMQGNLPLPMAATRPVQSAVTPSGGLPGFRPISGAPHPPAGGPGGGLVGRPSAFRPIDVSRPAAPAIGAAVPSHTPTFQSMRPAAPAPIAPILTGRRAPVGLVGPGPAMRPPGPAAAPRMGPIVGRPIAPTMPRGPRVGPAPPGAGFGAMQRPAPRMMHSPRPVVMQKPPQRPRR